MASSQQTNGYQLGVAVYDFVENATLDLNFGLETASKCTSKQRLRRRVKSSVC